MRVFLSYRRDDGIALPKLIKTKLLTHPKVTSVFLDIDDLGHDQPFPDRLRRQIARADLMLALIGPQWEGTGPDRTTRIQQEGDWVRAELRHALTISRTRLVPVLIDGRPMPQGLPDDIAKLADSNAIPLRSAHFDADIEDLARKLIGTGFGEPPSLLRRGVRAAAFVLLAFLGVIGFALAAQAAGLTGGGGLQGALGLETAEQMQALLVLVGLGAALAGWFTARRR